MSKENNFDFDFENEFENLFEKLISKDELHELYLKMKARYENETYLANPVVIQTISKMKEFLISKCEIPKENIKVNFNEMFNVFGLWVECDDFVVGNDIKIEFDSLIQRCNNFSVIALENGNFLLTFGFSNAFIFTNENHN